MVLAKTDLGIAARYVELVEDTRLGKRVFAAIEAEWQRVSDALERITGEPRRLASNPSLARSIEHRFPYLDPLNHLQVELMRRYRARDDGEPVNERVQRGIHISINGIAARYVELVEDARLGRRVFAAIEAEWQRVADALAQITGEQRRLATNPSLARSIEHRFPYLDPLNHLQVELMRRHRARADGEPPNERVQRGIHISINGIAAGLRNTG